MTRTYTIRLKDNQNEKNALNVLNCIRPQIVSQSDCQSVFELLREQSGKTVSEFPNIDVFPSPNDIGIQENGKIANEKIYILSGDNSDPVIHTYNIMGVLRLRDKEHDLEVTLEIGSRFDSCYKQLFLNYMLLKVFGGRFIDPVDIGRSNMWEILLILVFCKRLTEAYTQGLFKRYTQFEYNDTKYRGCLNLNEHLRKNVPFCGNIAYTTHEYSYDNPITRLIRHTLRHIQLKYPLLLDGAGKIVAEARREIEQHTPSWRSRDVLACIKENLKPIHHSFFYTYEPLRQVCLLVLEDEAAAHYNSDQDNEVEGVIFDGAWLWENYIATLLEDKGFESQKNIPAFKNPWDYPLKPDFYHSEKNIVLDAKYKRMAEKEKHPAREDIHQLMCYLYVTGSRIGGLICPSENNEAESFSTGIKTEWADDAQWHTVVLKIPSTDTEQDTDAFFHEISSSEKVLCNYIQSLK